MPARILPYIDDVVADATMASNERLMLLAKAIQSIAREEWSNSEALVEQVIELSDKERTDDEVLQVAWIIRARVCTYYKRHQQAVDNYLKAIEAAIEHALPHSHIIRIVGYWRLGGARKQQGATQQGISALRQAEQAADYEEFAREQAMIRSDMAGEYLELNDIAHALELYETAADELRRREEHDILAKVMINIATVRQRIGEHDKAIGVYQDVLRERHNTIGLPAKIGLLLNLALSFKEMQQWDQAKAVYLEIKPELAQPVVAGMKIRLQFAEADLSFRRGEYVECIALCEQARLQTAVGDGNSDIEVRALLATAMWHAGSKQEAIDIQHEVFKQAVESGITRVALECSADLSGWLQTFGMYKEAFDVMSTRMSIMQTVSQREQRRSLELAALRSTIAQERAVLHAVDEQRRELLTSVLPTHVAHRMLAGERRIAERHEHVAVMFADIVGFSQMASTMSAIDVINDLEELFIAFDDIVAFHGCEKIKTIGDSYMATGGTAGVIQDAQEERLLASALDMTRYLRSTGNAFRMRIGIHVGPVVAGVMGGKRMTYDVWGNTVNVAARMESTGESGRIQVSNIVAQALSETFLAKNAASLTSRGVIQPKGVAPLQTYWVDVVE